MAEREGFESTRNPIGSQGNPPFWGYTMPRNGPVGQMSLITMIASFHLLVGNRWATRWGAGALAAARLAQTTSLFP